MRLNQLEHGSPTIMRPIESTGIYEPVVSCSLSIEEFNELLKQARYNPISKGRLANCEAKAYAVLSQHGISLESGRLHLPPGTCLPKPAFVGDLTIDEDDFP